MFTRRESIKIIFLALLCFTTSFSQEELYIPRNILQAYEKGTRSFDGKPGAEYWQNNSDYKIDVEVDPSTYQITGSEEITYFNNSPDTLKRIVLRFYPNIFKKGSARDYAIVPEAVSDGVTINKISVNGRQINLENKSIFRIQNTLGTLYLPEPIAPNSSMNFEIDWSFYLSDKATLRVGVYDSTSVFVGYWYPQIAVYDDIDGWDFNNYDGQTEFYNDFSNFEVRITLPNHFGVWATGELQNPENVLNENILEKFLIAKNTPEVIRIVTEEDLINNSVYKNQSEKNTWIYKANNVTDFAFSFSDHYLWDGIRADVEMGINKSIFVQAVYPIESPDFKDVAEISLDLIQYFSSEMPGVIFPFTSLTAFNNGRSGGGMEFPMMINDGSPEKFESTVALTAHEISHQYFPFYVATNEKKYAFMDEGWAVMIPFKFMEKFAGVNARLINTIADYEKMAGTESDIPPIITSLSLGYSSYRNSAYNRSSIAYEILRDMLGDELFLKALQEFITRWQGKHPTPFDFFFTFDEVTEQNLNWYWKQWFFELGFPDLAIQKVEILNSKAKVTIQKIGNIPTPVHLQIIYENGNSEEYHYTAELWKDGNEYYSVEIELSDNLKEIHLGNFLIPDSNRENNIFLVH